MEEEIKRVEKFIEDIKGCGLSDCSSFKDEDVQALENLLHAYRILKENNKYLKMCTIGADPLLRVLKEGFIEKTKIKNKIEELKKIEYSNVELAKINETWESRILYEARKQYDYEIAQFTIKILQQLLEE